MTGNGRQSHADGVHSASNYGYKNPCAIYSVKNRPATVQPLGTFSFKRVASYTVGIMVSVWFFAKVFVAFAPLTSVVAQYATHPVLPELLDATADELISGLEAGDFTSLDLVQVSDYLWGSYDASLITTGVCWTYSRSECDLAYGHRDQSRCLGNRKRAG